MAPKASKASTKPSPKSKQAQASISRRQSTTTKLVKYSPEPAQPPAPQELDVKFRPQQPDSAPVLAKALAALRGRGELCDVMLVVKGGQLPAHKVVLTAQSEVLREMLQSVNNQESSTLVASSQENTESRSDVASEHIAQVDDSESVAIKNTESRSDVASEHSAQVDDSESVVIKNTESRLDVASEQSTQVDDSESVALNRPSQSYNAAGVGRKESLTFEALPFQEPAKTWNAEAKIEIPLGTTTIEALEWMLKWLYGEISTSEYRPTSDEVNLEVMTLSEDLKIPSLMELGACYIIRGVYAHNVLQRMLMCQKFGLLTVRELLVEALVRDRANLEGVVSNPEMSKQPHLLRELLSAVANQTGPSQEAGPPQKRLRK